MAKQPEINNATVFKELLLMKRRAMKPGNRKRTVPGKGLKWLPPIALERKYFRAIRELLSQVTNKATNIVQNNIGAWLNESELVFDAITEEIRVSREELESTIEELYKTRGEDVRLMISNTGFDVSEFNKKQFGKFLTQLVDISVIADEPWEREAIALWAEQNFTLIKSLSHGYIGRINDIVADAVQRGGTSQGVMKEIRKLNSNITKSKARLIARDQIGKLNGTFTQRRQRDLGIEMYKWFTVGDERVRGNPRGIYPKAIPSHWIMDGILCRWDDPTLMSLDDGKTWIKRTARMPKVHPGIDIQCRCTAIPFFDDLVEEIDAFLAEEDKQRRGAA